MVGLGTEVDVLSQRTVTEGILEMIGIHAGPMGNHVGGHHGNRMSGLGILICNGNNILSTSSNYMVDKQFQFQL